MLDENNISYDIIKVSRGNWPQIKTIYLSGNKIYEDEIYKLLYC